MHWVAGTTIYLRVYGYNIYSIPTHLSNVICQGSESRLIDCNATGSTLSNQDASMRCYSNVGEITKCISRNVLINLSETIAKKAN